MRIIGDDLIGDEPSNENKTPMTFRKWILIAHGRTMSQLGRTTVSPCYEKFFWRLTGHWQANEPPMVAVMLETLHHFGLGKREIVGWSKLSNRDVLR